MNERDYERNRQAQAAYHKKLHDERDYLARRNYEMRERQMKMMKQEGSDKKQGCFIATATFGDYDAPEVVFLRTFRDESLSQSVLGRGFIQAYYTISPSLAAVIAKSKPLRRIVRKFFLQPVISLLRYIKRQ